MRRLVILLCALTSLAACSDGSVGSSCAGSATEDVCVEGAVCTPDRSPTDPPPADPNADTYHCRAICEVEADCPEPGFECRSVSGGTVSACQPEDDPITPGADGGV